MLCCNWKPKCPETGDSGVCELIVSCMYLGMNYCMGSRLAAV